MTLHTKIQPNGAPGKYEVVWSTTMKIIAGVFTALISAGVISSVLLNTKVEVMKHQLEDINDKIEYHMRSEGTHENPEVKTERILRLIKDELGHHEKEMHKDG